MWKMTALESCPIRKSDKRQIKGSYCQNHLQFKPLKLLSEGQIEA